MLSFFVFCWNGSQYFEQLVFTSFVRKKKNKNNPYVVI